MEKSEAQSANHPTDSEWHQRKLCSDENCIGVIGPDGRCKECGKPYADDPDPAALPPQPVPVQDPPPIGSAAEETDSSRDEWENRRLCRDENCIGVIGPDGRCKECGKPYTG